MVCQEIRGQLMVEERLAPSIRQLKAEATTTIRGIDGTETCLQIVNMICQPNSLSTDSGCRINEKLANEANEIARASGFQFAN